jgi:transcriptional regulator with PAS, ATPase and Fis domain
LLSLRAGDTPTLPPPDDGAEIVSDASMRRMYALLDVIGPSPLAILVLGETGVGKELYAEAAHRRSARASRPFLKLNCAALPESILEGELFGYEKGAFTGATQARAGLFESADGGTVLLDEVGEMPLATQAKLLRVLESGEVLRLGSRQPRRVDVRFLSATNRDLRALAADGRFRADLYFRLNGVSVTLPPLRRRVHDIAPLARSFAQRTAAQLGRKAPHVGTAALAVLEGYAWPGNVRELRNVVERATIMCAGHEIQPEHLLLETIEPAAPPEDGRLADRFDAVKRRAILEALDKTAGNQLRAARLLGIARSTLVKEIERYGLPRPRKARLA